MKSLVGCLSDKGALLPDPLVTHKERASLMVSFLMEGTPHSISNFSMNSQLIGQEL